MKICPVGAELLQTDIKPIVSFSDLCAKVVGVLENKWNLYYHTGQSS